MKKYREFKIIVKPLQSDLLSGFFWDFDITGLTEDDNLITVYANEITNLNTEKIISYLENLKKEKIINEFTVDEKILIDKNWNKEWEKKRKVVRIGKKTIIKPSFKSYKKKKGEIVITIDPKMSFGTGEHSSTKLMIRLLEKYIKKNDKILDVGTGTGILSIASVKLGASKVIAIDNDEWSYRNSKENFRLNNVQEMVKVKLGEINKIKERNFDLILANIQKNVILEIAPQIKDKVKKGGSIILSGLLIEDKNDVERCYFELGFKLLKTVKDKEWIALVLQF